MLKTLISKFTRHLTDWRAWLAFIAGGTLTLAYAPFGFWPLVFICLYIAIQITDTPQWKRAASYGFCFGFGWFAVGISWVHVSIAEFGGLPLAISLLLMMLLCGYLALYPMLAFIFASRFTAIPWQRTIALIVGFAVTEWLRGKLLTGFPWLSFGYTLTDTPLSSIAPFIGEFGLTLLCILLPTLAYYSIRKQAYIQLGIWALFVTAITTLPLFSNPTKHSEQSINVLLVQGNIKQSLRWEPEYFWPTMSKYRDLTRTQWQDVDLVVWPEAAIPEFEDIAYPFLQGLDKAAVFNNTAVITGIPDYQFDTKRAYNTLIVLGKKQAQDTEGHYQYLHTNRYQKHQLLPIGEFVPFEKWLRPIAPLFNLEMSSFARGDQFQANLTANGLQILPAICYEIAFSELVRGNLHDNSDILFTVSNDAWFGDSHGPHQHMQIARMRAIELQLPLIRVTNNGISGVFDPITQTQSSLPQFEEGTLKQTISLISGKSWYAIYGNQPIWIMLALLSVVLFASKALPMFRQRLERNYL
ncbi:apolipoprotein N-acyltransferase [Pseudoalteromonas sp. T1lg65]|uniref:apolipoprotein N-acyltransferase n=1 Tax=Pseudoalteromonas sp. T1lg65 TaxID=2077101 RepID=UPI003F7A3360